MHHICNSLSNLRQFNSDVFNESRSVLSNLNASTLKKAVVVGLLIQSGFNVSQTAPNASNEIFANIQIGFQGSPMLSIEGTLYQAESPIIPIDVRTVPIIASEISLQSVKLKKGTEEATYRIENAKMLQQRRWEWIQENPEKYVNLLRSANLTDESIHAMSTREFPLGFKNKEQYKQFKGDLYKTIRQISVESGVKNFRIIQQGSYVTGYSSSPMKGERVIPNHIFNDQSDLDLRITAEGIVGYINANNITFEVKSYYPNLIEPDSLVKVFPKLHDFTMRWATQLGRNLQVTVTKIPTQEFEPNSWDQELFAKQYNDS